MEQEQLFIDYIEQSIIQNWDRNALTDYQGITLQYKDVARKIAKFHIVLESAGIQPGDKIAVCGRNSAHWAVCFLATVTYGAVIVPILHEFKADNIHNIVNHSEAKLLFVGDRAWENLNEEAMPLLMGVVLLTDFTPVVCRDERLMEAFEHRNATYGALSQELPPRTYLLPQRTVARRAGGYQLYVRHYRLFQRRDAALPQLMVQYSLLPRNAARTSRRPYRIHAPSGACFRHGLRFSLRFLGRRTPLFPHPHAVAKDYRAVILRNQAACHILRAAHRREDYQEKHPATHRQQDRQTAATDAYRQR